MGYIPRYSYLPRTHRLRYNRPVYFPSLVESMEVNWRNVLWKAAEEVMKRGGRVEFIVYKRDNKRKPIIHIYPDNERSLQEIELVD